MRWTFKPWMRRIVTRLIAIVPCIIVAGAVGQKGLSAALNASQVALSILLPFLTAPLIYLTCLKRVMVVTVAGNANANSNDGGDISARSSITQNDEIDVHETEGAYRTLNMANGPLTKITGVGIWLFISVLNVYLIVHLATYGS